MITIFDVADWFLSKSPMIHGSIEKRRKSIDFQLIQEYNEVDLKKK